MLAQARLQREMEADGLGSLAKVGGAHAGPAGQQPAGAPQMKGKSMSKLEALEAKWAGGDDGADESEIESEIESDDELATGRAAGGKNRRREVAAEDSEESEEDEEDEELDSEEEDEEESEAEGEDEDEELDSEDEGQLDDEYDDGLGDSADEDLAKYDDEEDGVEEDEELDSEDEGQLDDEYDDGLGDSADEDLAKYDDDEEEGEEEEEEEGEEEAGEEEDEEDEDEETEAEEVAAAAAAARGKRPRDLYGQGDAAEAPKRSKVDAARDGATPRAVAAASSGAASGGKYVPPALRAAGASDASGVSEATKRRLRGLLNRLSEQNLGTVSGEISELFAEGRSRELGAELTRSLLGSSLSETQLLSPLVLLHAALLRALSIRLGPQLLYFFVEAIVLAFEAHLKKARAVSSASQQHQACCNATLFLAQLYNFRALHCTLIFDLVRSLVDGFGEAELEMLTLLLRTVGAQLRADDASALKEIVLQVQGKSGEKAEQSPRARVFISMLVDLKNNKQKSKEKEAAEGTLGRLQKLLRQLVASGGGTEPPPFNVQWHELVEADVRGRWWLVGSAWAGRAGSKGEVGTGAVPKKGASKEEKLLSLAQAQRMNTDVRRSIFVAVMGAEDYVDAHERISKLRLKKGQQPEIVRVLFECCGQEGVFNRFYALLAARLCASHREVKFTMQFAFWDEFKARRY